MMNAPYSQMTNEDHNDLCAWFDENMRAVDGANNPDMVWVRGANPVHDDEGVRCGCEDYPCCGH